MSESDYTALYEVINVGNGKIALRKVGDEKSDPLVTVQFSEQAKFFLGGDYSDVARVMIEAGLDAVSDLKQYSPEAEELSFDSVEDPDAVVH